MDVPLFLCEHRCGQDQGSKLKGVQAPISVSAWAHHEVETFSVWMGFLPVRSVYLWDPAIDGASQTGLPKHRCSLLRSAPPRSHGSCSSRAAGAEHKPKQLISAGAAQAETRFSHCASPVPKSWMHQALQFSGPSAWQLSSALNLLFKLPSVLYPEGAQEQMQPVKSGFNSPASFNLLPCLLINDSALGVLGIQIFFSVYRRIQCRGCALRVSSRLCHVSFEAASLWISLPQQHLQTLSSSQQLHPISSQGPIGLPTCSPSRCSWFSATWLYFQGHRLLFGAPSRYLRL